MLPSTNSCTYAFVRSRTYYREYDYRLLTPITAISKHINNYFSDCVRQLLKDSSSYSPVEWDEPIWLLVKNENCLLWGIAINNRIFSKKCYKEEFGRDVRCFCGVVFVDYDAESIELPYSISAFQPIFDNVVGRMWKERIFESENVEVDIGKADKYIHSGCKDNSLNLDEGICRLLPNNVDKEKLLSAALTVQSNVSIAIDVIEDKQVSAQRTSLRNAVIRYRGKSYDIVLKEEQNNPKEEKHDGNNVIGLEEIHVCPKCGKKVRFLNNHGIYDECKRRKTIKRLIYICAGALIAGMLMAEMFISHKATDAQSAKQEETIIQPEIQQEYMDSIEVKVKL